MKLNIATSTAWASIICAGATIAAPAPTANLSYATYEGAALSNGINQFLGMRYAAPPLGNNRFRLPQPPANENGTVRAIEHGNSCLSVSNSAPPSIPTNEDCLFIDVYGPANASSTNASLPVLLWISGGGFVELLNVDYNGTGLIEAAQRDAVVVSFNYRVGPYGFLASQELADEHNLNAGIFDQRMAMTWVHHHIDKFGGDANKLTLFGTSVGGGSVLLQTVAYGGAPPSQDAIGWNAGITESMFVPQVLNVSDLAFQYSALLNGTGCSDLACLRQAPIDKLQAANVARPFPGQQQNALFGWAPVVDGALFPDRPSVLLQQGKFAKDKQFILGSSHTEGTIFAPQANNTNDLQSFLSAQFPLLNSSDFRQIETLYADIPQTYPGVTQHESAYYYKTATAYGDSAFNCPAIQYAEAFSKAGIPVYLFRDNITDPVELAAGFIVPHTWEVQAVWGPQYSTQYVALAGATSYNAGQSNSGSVPVVQGYWTSFARTLGGPNRLRLNGATEWQRYSNGSRLRLQTNATAMEVATSEELARCQFWGSITGKLRQ